MTNDHCKRIIFLCETEKDYACVIPSKVDLLMEKEEVDGGYHDLYQGDECRCEDRALLFHAPRHYQVAGYRPNDPLRAQFDCRIQQSII